MKKYERLLLKCLWEYSIYLIGLLFGLGYFTYNLQREALQTQITAEGDSIKEIKTRLDNLEKESSGHRDRLTRIETTLAR